MQGGEDLSIHELASNLSAYKDQLREVFILSSCDSFDGFVVFVLFFKIIRFSLLLSVMILVDLIKDLVMDYLICGISRVFTF